MLIAASREIQFSRRSLLDPAWYRAWRGVRQAMLNERRLLENISYASLLSAYAAQGITPELSKSLKILHNCILNVSEPWNSKTIEERDYEHQKNLSDTYHRIIGSDPDYERKLQETVEFLTGPKKNK